MAKIAFFEIEPWEKEYFSDRIKGHEFLFFEEKLSEENVNKVRDCDLIVVFIFSEITRELLDRFFKLKFIVTMSTGFDHIDLIACKEMGITVSNVPFYGENTVAEHAMALLLTISRKITQTYDQVLHNDFSLNKLRGFDLKGKTIGVIGTGHIGMHFIRMAKGFDMNVIAYDPFPKQGADHQLGFTYMGFEDVLRH